jgi:hypothetical protein
MTWFRRRFAEPVILKESTQTLPDLSAFCEDFLAAWQGWPGQFVQDWPGCVSDKMSDPSASESGSTLAFRPASAADRSAQRRPSPFPFLQLATSVDPPPLLRNKPALSSGGKRKAESRKRKKGNVQGGRFNVQIISSLIPHDVA